MSEAISQPDKPMPLPGADAAPGDATDLFSKFDPLIKQRADLLGAGQEDPFNLVMEQVL